MVLSAGGERRREAASSAESFLEAAGSKTIVLKEFRDGFLPYQGTEVKEFFEELKPM